ncbi:MAG: hypothetical protein OXU20_11700, partial [Myxococcales bacterium]|nr:hypothetical protein [Myxococcales bacterium]
MRVVLAVVCSAAIGCVASETQPPSGGETPTPASGTTGEPHGTEATAGPDDPGGAIEAFNADTAGSEALAGSDNADEPIEAFDADVAASDAMAGSEAEPVEAPGASELGGNSMAAPGAVLMLPLEPRDMGTLNVAFEMDADSLSLPPVESSLALAIGEKYPERFGAVLAGRLECVTMVQYSISSVAVTEAGLDVQTSGDDTLEFRIGRPGTYTVVIEGQVVADEPLSVDREPCVELLGSGAPVAFQVNLSVDVRRVGGALVEFVDSCRGYMLSGSGFRVSLLERAPWSSEELRLRALDEQGAIFEPKNASYRAPVSVSVHATADTRLSLRSGSEPGFEHPTRGATGLIMLVAEGPDQRISVHSAWGEAGGFELVGQDRIDGMRVQFQQEFGYGKARPVELVSGNTFAASSSDDGVKPTWVNARVTDLQIGTETVCSDAPNGAFELRSLTPMACAVTPEPLWDPVHTAPDALASAKVVALGQCALELEAPAFDSGRGVTAAISV